VDARTRRLAEEITDFPDVLPRWLAAMRRGDFEEAWRQTDRIELPRRAAEKRGNFRREPHHLVWNGEPFAGRRVLVRCEHGLGDTIQFARYFPVLRQEASCVIAKVQPALLELFAGMGGIDLLINGWTAEPDPEHDLEIECMELPYAFRSTPGTLPAKVPYLPISRIEDASALRVEWPKNEQRIAVVWSASSWDTTRSVSLAQLAPIFRVEGCRFYSLQQGREREEMRTSGFPIEPLSERTEGAREAAAAMLAMDLVIAIDGMPAHLAGALGRPTWVLLQHTADWRWMDTGTSSPWYPTMRLFRQPAPGEWEPAIEQMASALAQWATREPRTRGEALILPRAAS
jgi:hypothetical protein